MRMSCSAGGLSSWAAVLGTWCVASSAASAQATSTACPADQAGLRLPAGFCATLFADGIGHARHLVVAPNGVVYVNTWSGSYYGKDAPHAGGFLVALQDTSGAGKADMNQRFGETVQSGGAGGTGIGMYKGALYAEINDRIVRYTLVPGSNIPRDPPQTIVSGLPLGGDHPMHPFAIDAEGTMYVDATRTNFPSRYRHGVFIAFHGSWNRAPFPQSGYNVVFQSLAGDQAAGNCEIFADGFAGTVKSPEKAVHRPTGVAVGPDGSLYVSDDVRGRIYKIVYRGGPESNGGDPGITPCPSATAAAGDVSVAGARPPEGVHPDAGAATASVPIAAGATKAMMALGDRIYHGQVGGASIAVPYRPWAAQSSRPIKCRRSQRIFGA